MRIIFREVLDKMKRRVMEGNKKKPTMEGKIYNVDGYDYREKKEIELVPGCLLYSRKKDILMDVFSVEYYISRLTNDPTVEIFYHYQGRKPSLIITSGTIDQYGIVEVEPID